MKAHYHMLSGCMAGCLPETNHAFAVKRDALRAARDEARQAREDGCTVRGTAETGYSVDHGYIEVAGPCERTDCYDEDEGTPMSPHDAALLHRIES